MSVGTSKLARCWLGQTTVLDGCTDCRYLWGVERLYYRLKALQTLLLADSWTRARLKWLRCSPRRRGGVTPGGRGGLASLGPPPTAPAARDRRERRVWRGNKR